MAEHPAAPDRTDDGAARWATPGYTVVETSMEVTAYLADGT